MEVLANTEYQDVYRIVDGVLLIVNKFKRIIYDEDKYFRVSFSKAKLKSYNKGCQKWLKVLKEDYYDACNGFGIRTEHINLLNGLKNNKTFVYIAAGIVLGTIALCNALGGLIQATAMNMSQWIAIIGLSLTVIVVDVIRKLFIKGENKNHGTI